MYYKKFIPKEELLTKRDLLYSFMILEKRHLTSRGENRWISLHCKYDIDTHEFSSEDLAIYLIADEETDRVKHFVDNWGFEKEETFPRGLQHVLGNYNMTIKALDGFIA